MKWDVTLSEVKIWVKRVTGHICEASEGMKMSVTEREISTWKCVK